MVLSKSQEAGIIVAAVVFITGVILLILYFTNILVPRYTCKNGICEPSYKGSLKNKKCNCSQQLFQSDLIYHAADHKDSNVVNGVTLLMLGYIDTSQYKVGDTMTWILNAFITDQGENDKLCLGATIVNTDAFFKRFNNDFKDGNEGVLPGQTPWETGQFVHSFAGPPSEITPNPETQFLKILSSDDIFFLGDKSNLSNFSSEFPGRPVGYNEVQTCGVSGARAKPNTISAPILSNGIGKNAYFAFLWFTHSNKNDVKLSINYNLISFTSK